MLVHIIAPMGQQQLRGILIFVARFQFFFVCMAIRAEGLFMADSALLLALRRVKLMPCVEIIRVIQRSPVICVALTAYGKDRYFHRVLDRDALRTGAGIDNHGKHG